MTRSYSATPHPQPSRRAVVLVYLACIAVPFAVATLAYLFRAALAAPESVNARFAASHNAARVNHLQAHEATTSRASTASLLPSAAAAELNTFPNATPPGK
jgi:hypothetical protein